MTKPIRYSPTGKGLAIREDGELVSVDDYQALETEFLDVFAENAALRAQVAGLKQDMEAMREDRAGVGLAIDAALRGKTLRNDAGMKSRMDMVRAMANENEALRVQVTSLASQIIDALRTQAAENADIVRKEGYQEGIADAIAVVQRLAGAA